MKLKTAFAVLVLLLLPTLVFADDRHQELGVEVVDVAPIPPISSASAGPGFFASTFEQGKAAYMQGRYKEAFDAWEPLLPHLQDDSKIKKYILQAEKARLSDMLNTLNFGLEKVRRQKAGTDQHAQKRQSSFEEVFEEGDDAYRRGDFPAALAAWKRLDKLVGGDPQIERLINQAEHDYHNLFELQRAADPVAAMRDIKAATAKELAGLLDKTDRSLDALVHDRSSQRKAALDKVAAEKAAYAESMDRIEKLIGAERYEDALKAVEAMDGRVDLSSQRAAIDAVRAKLAALREAKAGAEEAERLSRSPLTVSDALKTALDKASKDLQSQIDGAASRRSAAVLALKARRASLDKIIEGLRSDLAAGRYSEAEADDLRLYLDEKSFAVIKTASSALISSSNELARQKSEAARAEAAVAAPLAPPRELAAELDKASQNLQIKINEAAARRSAALDALKTRRATLDKMISGLQSDVAAGRFSEEKADELRPYVDEAFLKELKDASAALAASANELARRKSDAARAEAAASAPLTPPQALLTALKSARDQMTGEIQKAGSSKAAAEAAIAQKEAALSTIVEKGRASAADGHFDEALSAWESGASLWKADPPLEEAIRQAKADAKTLEKRRQESEAAIAKQNQPPAVPDDLKAGVSQAHETIQGLIRQADAEKLAAENALAARRTAFDQKIKSLAALLSKGRYEEAMTAADAVASDAGKDEDFARSLADFKAAYSGLQENKRLADLARQENTLPLKLDNALKETFEQSRRTIEAERAKIEADRRVYESGRAAEAMAAIEKGRVLAAGGNFEEAFKVWESQLALWRNVDGLKRSLEKARQALSDLDAARKAADEARQRREVPFAVPDKLRESLSAALATLQSRAQEAAAEKTAAEKILSGRQDAFAKRSDAAIAFLNRGEEKGALDAFALMAPDVQDADFNGWAGRLKASAAESDAARDQAAEAQKQSLRPFTVPGDLKNALESRLQALDTRRRENQAQKQRFDAQAASRRSDFFGASEKVASLYRSGDIDGGLKATEPLFGYLDEASSAAMKETVNKLHDLTRRLDESKQAAARAQMLAVAPLPAPDALDQALTQAGWKLSEEMEKTKKDRDAAQARLTRRQEAFAATIEKGRGLCKAGRCEEAFDVWESLAPELSDAPAFKKAVENDRRDWKALKMLESENERLHAVELAPLPAPAGLEKAVAEAGDRLVSEARQARAKRGDIERRLAARRASFLQAVRDTETLLAQGEYEKGFDSLAGLGPGVSEDIVVKDTLRDLKSARTDLDMAKAQAEQAELLTRAAFKAPADLKSHLEAAAQSIEAERKKVEADKERFEKISAAHRDAFVRAGLEVTKLYDAGRYEEAFQRVEALYPYLDAASVADIQASNDEIRAAVSRLAAERRAADALKAEAAMAHTIHTPDSVRQALARLDADLKKVSAEKQSAEATLEQRKAKVIQTFEQGREFYRLGFKRKALDVWESLLPMLDDGSEMKNLILDLKKELDGETTPNKKR